MKFPYVPVYIKLFESEQSESVEGYSIVSAWAAISKLLTVIYIKS